VREPGERWVERGTDIERTVFFSDAVFAIAMTLLAFLAVVGICERHFANREGGGSLKYTVVLQDAHTPSKNSRPISRTQAYIAYLLNSDVPRTSPNRSSKKLALGFGLGHHACGGEIPL
jgi:hypothetical protein